MGRYRSKRVNNSNSGVSLNYYQHAGGGGGGGGRGGGGGGGCIALPVCCAGGGRVFRLVRMLFCLTIGGSVVYMYVGYLVSTFSCVDTGVGVPPYLPCLPSALIGNLSITDYDAIASAMKPRSVGGAKEGTVQWDRGPSCGTLSPCRYPEQVSLRIIVLVLNRFRSLRRLLDSLDALEMDASETSALEIWIDRDRKGFVSQRAYDVATNFAWRHGTTRVYVHRSQVGLYGQWMRTWRPPPSNETREGGGGELALILEDDVSVSRHAWRWIRAVHATFGHRTDIAGYTLQSENVNRADGKGALPVTANDTTYLYGIVGSWGFVPHPARWTEFLTWYDQVSKQRLFKPYVEGFFQTDWYRKFEKDNRQDTMWTMWFIRFCVDNGLSVVYANLSSFVEDRRIGSMGSGMVAGRLGLPRKGGRGSLLLGASYFLAVHRQEPGLHFFGRPRDGTYRLLTSWSDDYVRALTSPDSHVKKYDYFNGTWTWSRVGGDSNRVT